MIKRALPFRKGVGYGYVGVWNDGRLGWFMPCNLTTSTVVNTPKWLRRNPDKPQREDWNEGERGYLCKITVELVRDRRGRPIIRKVKP